MSNNRFLAWVAQCSAVVDNTMFTCSSVYGVTAGEDACARSVRVADALDSNAPCTSVHAMAASEATVTCSVSTGGNLGGTTSCSSVHTLATKEVSQHGMHQQRKGISHADCVAASVVERGGINGGSGDSRMRNIVLSDSRNIHDVTISAGGSDGIGMHVPHFLRDMAIAASASAAHTTFTYPLHRVKGLMQTQDALPAVASGNIARFTLPNVVARIVSEQGVAGLWRGLTPYVLRRVPSTSLSFSFKDALLQVLPGGPSAAGGGGSMQGGGTGGSMQGEGGVGRPKACGGSASGTDGGCCSGHTTRLMRNLAAGGLAGTMALAVVYPLDFTSIRMAADLRGTPPRMFDELRAASKGGDPRAWYRGFGVSALAIGAYKALYFGLWDTAKHYIGDADGAGADAEVAAAAGASGSGDGRGSTDDGSSSSSSSSVSGCRSGDNSSVPSVQLGLLGRWAVASGVVLVASTLTYPLDVMRKRLVVDTMLPASERRYAGLADCMAKTLSKEGLRGFYRFYGADIVMRLGGGILLVVYDEAKAALDAGDGAAQGGMPPAGALR